MPSGGYAITPWLYSLNALPNQVDYINPLTIDWKVSFDNGASFLSAGSSSNTFYITLNSSQTTNLFHTVVHLACSHGGATDTNTAFANTWSFFPSRNVTTWDGRPLYYYRSGLPFSNTCTTTPFLLKQANANGQCGAFRALLGDALSANGVPWAAVTITHAQTNLFLVKDWTFGAPSFSNAIPSSAPYIWKLQFPTNLADMVPLPSGSVFGDITSLSTLGGQNTVPPAEKAFGSHYIIRIGSTYYDPSYGVTYTGELDFENIAVDGYGMRFSTDNNPTNLIFRIKQSTGLNEIRFFE